MKTSYWKYYRIVVYQQIQQVFLTPVTDRQCCIFCKNSMKRNFQIAFQLISRMQKRQKVLVKVNRVLIRSYYKEGEKTEYTNIVSFTFSKFFTLKNKSLGGSSMVLNSRSFFTTSLLFLVSLFSSFLLLPPVESVFKIYSKNSLSEK